MGGKRRVHIRPAYDGERPSSLSSSIHLSAAAMPGPAVYIAFAVVGVVAVGVAFHEYSLDAYTYLRILQFVYEPHIAPKVEIWAESFLERRRQKKRQRQGPILADPHPLEQGDENSLRRLVSNPRDKKNDDNYSMSIELEQLAAKEREAWRQDAGSSSGLRQRKAASAMDEVIEHLHPIPCNVTHARYL
ncbi:hypothetical protein NUW54_g10611 [Trametes sanguinea]|uniref:Uncharacterized protein n=1 Tax=Trametes sanguinea TaxID=158606 RepID=A0ACC1NXJ2_9APHY|nr:hypothetical protein NUW54_g10611 [Trametes sanguinea]